MRDGIIFYEFEMKIVAYLKVLQSWTTCHGLGNCEKLQSLFRKGLQLQVLNKRAGNVWIYHWYK